MKKMFKYLKQDLKNLPGWRTRRKLLVFSVDDYGNVRLDSGKAREDLDRAGLKALSRFDAYDTLETREDLEMLFGVLESFRDVHGRPARFTTYALPCNIDFEKMAEEDYGRYHFELLPKTFEKTSALDPPAYQGAWSLLQEGIGRGLMVPQFHGREHFNVHLFEELLQRRDRELLTSLRTRSLASISVSDTRTPGYTAAFGFREFKENQAYESIIEEGIAAFEEVYGYRPVQFTPPGGEEHRIVHAYAGKYGISGVDVPLIKREHQGGGRYRTRFYYTGRKNPAGITYFVRNVVFEPTESGEKEAVNLAMKQIESAFRWNRPAIISSHRVNFCGHVDPANRQLGLRALGELLKQICRKWPEVEFISADQLGGLVTKSKRNN